MRETIYCCGDGSFFQRQAMQMTIKPKGMDGWFECSLGMFMAVPGAPRNGWEDGFVAELDTDDVFWVGTDLRFPDEPQMPSISVVEGMNVMVGMISECFAEDQTAVLDMGDAKLIFEYEGTLHAGRWVEMKCGPFTVYPVHP